MRDLRLFFILFILLLSSSTSALAVLITSSGSGSGNWNDPASWSGGVPIPGDDVLILGGHTITLTQLEDCSNLIVDGTLYINSFSLNCRDVSGNGSITMTSGLWTISGNNTHAGAFTHGTGTVIYNRADGFNQTVRGNVDYYNLSISGSLTKTISAPSPQTRNIFNNFHILNSGPAMDVQLSGNISNLIIGGNVLLQRPFGFAGGIMQVVDIYGNLDGTGSATGAFIMPSSNNVLNLHGLTNDFLGGITGDPASTICYNGSGSQSVFTSLNYKTLKIQSTAGANLSGNIRVATLLDIGTSLTTTNDIVLEGHLHCTGTLNASAKVAFTGSGVQNITGTFSPMNFFTFEVNKISGVVNLNRQIAINDDLLMMGGDLNANSYPISLMGDFIHNSGTFISTNTFTLEGTTDQQIGGSALQTNFYDLVLNKSSGIVRTNHRVNVSNSTIVDVPNFLDLGEVPGHVLGSVYGGGTIALSAPSGMTTSFPAGDFSVFLSSFGTIEYNGANNYYIGHGSLPSSFSYYHHLRITGTGVITLPADPININGKLDIVSGSYFVYDASAVMQVMQGVDVNGTLEITPLGAMVVDGLFHNFTMGTVTLDGDLVLRSDLQNTGSFTGSPGSILSFTGTLPKNITGTMLTLHELNLNMTPGTPLGINSSVRVNGDITFNSNGFVRVGGNIVLGPSSSIVNLDAGTFGPSRMIETIGGKVIKEGSSDADFIRMYPLGTDNFYCPFNITSLTGVSGPELIEIQVNRILTAPVGVSEYVDVELSLNSAIVATDFQFSFGFDGANIIGSPIKVYRYNSTTPNLVTSEFLNISSAPYSFGVSGTGNTNITGEWRAMTLSTTPFVDYFTPTTGCPGATVIIYGNHFIEATDVRIGGASVSFTVIDNYQISVTTNGVDGTVEVQNPYNTGTSGSIFTHDPPTTASTGAPYSDVCKGSSILLMGSASGGTISWSGGDGSFDNTNSLSVTYTPGANDILSGSVTISINVTGACGPASDMTMVNILSGPVATATPSGATTFCSGGSVDLNASPIAGNTFQWMLSGSYVGITTDSYNVTTAGDYAVEITDAQGCKDTSSIITITVDNPPSTSLAGGPQSVCGGTATFTANIPSVGTGAWTVISGTGTIATNDDPVSTITGLGAGANIFEWTITNGVCPPSASSVTITNFNSPTTALAGSDQNVCGTAATMAANTPVDGTGTWSLQGGTATIADPTNPATSITGIGFGPPAVLRWTISNGPCTPSFEDVNIFAYNNPSMAVAGSDQNLCISATTLGATMPSVGFGTWSLESGSGTIMNAPDPGSPFNTIGAGVNKLVWTTQNGPCPVSTDTVIIFLTLLPPTPGTISGTASVCELQTGVAYSIATVPDATGYNWYNSSGTIIGTTENTTADFGTVSGNICVEAENGCGVSASQSCLPVTVNTAAVAIAGGDQMICADAGSVALSGSLGGGATTGQWLTSGTGAFSPNSTTLTASYTPDATEISTGIATLVLQNTDGCGTDKDTVVIFINPLPSVSAGGNQTICGPTSVAISGTVNTPYGGFWSSSGSGTFNPDATTLTASYQPSAADLLAGFVDLTLDATGIGSCNPVSSVVTIFFNPSPDVSMGITSPSNALCGGANGVISLLTSESGVSYQGFTSGISVTPAIAGTGSLLNLPVSNGGLSDGLNTIIVKAVNNCITDTLTSTAIVKKSSIGAPVISFPGASQLCNTSNSVVEIHMTSAAYDTIQWFIGNSILLEDTNLVYKPVMAGAYKVVAGDSLCTFTSNTLTVTSTVAAPGVTVSGNNDQLSTPAGASTYQWYANGKAIFGATASSYTVFYNADYFVAVNFNGCRVASVIHKINNAAFDTLAKMGFAENDSMIYIQAPLEKNADLSAYPNPARDQLTVHYRTASVGRINVEVFNTMGDKVISREVMSYSGIVTTSFEDMNLTPGLYVLVITDGNERVARNIQIQ